MCGTVTGALMVSSISKCSRFLPSLRTFEIELQEALNHHLKLSSGSDKGGDCLDVLTP